MKPAVLDRPGSLFASSSVGNRMTLEERLNSVLHAARMNGSVECPVCHARMTSTRAGTPGAGAPGATGAGAPGASVGAECGGCGSRLS